MPQTGVSLTANTWSADVRSGATVVTVQNVGQQTLFMFNGASAPADMSGPLATLLPYKQATFTNLGSENIYLGCNQPGGKAVVIT